MKRLQKFFRTLNATINDSQNTRKWNYNCDETSNFKEFKNRYILNWLLPSNPDSPLEKKFLNVIWW